MNLTVYHYPNCGTCREAVKWLRNQGHELELIHMFDEPPSENELSMLIRNSELDIKKFFNVSGEKYKELGMKDRIKSMTEADKIRILSENGRLLKRPIVTDGKRVTVGYKDELFAENWSQV